MKYAPILIPTLCRYEHFVRLMESLKTNTWAKNAEIFVALDYPPSDKYVENWKQIDEYLNHSDLSVFKNVHVIRREKNYGAFGNIDDLQNFIREKYDRWVCLPDDIIVSPNFIEYMNVCLDKYENDNDIVAVCGYSYPVDWDVSLNATCFRQNFNCAVWGIGFWKNKYQTVSDDIESGAMLASLHDVIRCKRYKRMIDVCFSEYIIAACYKWSYGHQWLLNLSDIGLRAYLAVRNKYAITPVISKCRNYGFDGSGAFCCNTKTYSDKVHALTYDYTKQPIDKASNWNLVENTNDTLEVNRNKLNIFDARSDKYMKKARKLLWLCENIGIRAGKTYCLMALPMDFAIRAFNKYVRKQK